MRETRSKSRSPMPPPLLQPDNQADTFVQDQVGGGSRRQPSPPPTETPTRLRPRIKPTVRDTGLVQQAEHRRARLVDTHDAETHLQFPANIALVSNQSALPVSKLNVEPSFFPLSSHPLIALLHLVPRRLHPTSLGVPYKKIFLMQGNH